MNNLFDVEIPSWVNHSFSNPNSKIRIATLFSGIGAAEQALKKLNLNHEIVFASDNDKHVKKSYFANYDIDEARWYDDVKNINGTKYAGQVDILVGGSPCQSFSGIGKQLGFEDTRGTLFYEFARIIKECQPKVFIYENVRALMSHDNKKTFQTVINTFNEIGYDYHFKVLNAKDFGIPQSRNRIFVIGFKEKTKFTFPELIPLTTTTFDYLESVVDASYMRDDKTIQSIFKRKEISGMTRLDTNIMPCQLVNQGRGSAGYFVSEKKIAEKYFLSETKKNFIKERLVGKYAQIDKTVSQCQTARQFTCWAGDFITEQNRIRALTPRECLRLMGFDDSFKIVVSDAQMYKQCGNSIVCNVLEALFCQINIAK